MILVSYAARPGKALDVVKELRAMTGCNLKNAARVLDHGIVLDNPLSVGDATYFMTRAYSLAYGADNIIPTLTVDHNYVPPRSPATLTDLGLIERT